MRNLLPHPAEVEIFGTYFPPILLAAILGIIAMMLTTRWLARRRLLRYLIFPNFSMTALAVIYTVIIATFVIPA